MSLERTPVQYQASNNIFVFDEFCRRESRMNASTSKHVQMKNNIKPYVFKPYVFERILQKGHLE